MGLQSLAKWGRKGTQEDGVTVDLGRQATVRRKEERREKGQQREKFKMVSRWKRKEENKNSQWEEISLIYKGVSSVPNYCKL